MRGKVAASLPGEQASASSPPPEVGLETTCALGFYDGSKLVPLTAANDQLPSAAKVTITNPSNTGVTLGGFVIEMYRHNRLFLSVDATHQEPNLPYFLAPGASYRKVLQYSLLSGEGVVSFNTYLHGTCTISTFSV
jgi:hypothetical protein